MRFLLAFVVTGLAASGGWLVWGLGRSWKGWRQRRHELRVAQVRAGAELREVELRTRLREQELANETYQDFVRRHPDQA